ncbi:MAG: LysR family transcriptional regulator [Maritimibacter harenae]|jgi:DNA-binding transcriptional LysR family regulator|uniref:LysR family transcriptional regulator n=1 Tax=Maritimibacter harenae TaxID=2606218 RepID=A0A845M7U2_9RHOB|nr:LysR family transcriptional regulator [Maritimibacter harenae]MZR14748.1 LysR family transcriptional regulator [Maritimibacter harenae]
MLGKLEMFIALSNERHFGRAAESLGITQPTLSAGIKQLEAELGVKLVQRGSRFGGLTPEGARTLEWARQIVGDARRLREEMRFSREGLSGHLRLAVIPTALTWASRLAARFSAAHPNVTFTILSRASTEILDMLDNLETDVGLSYLDNEPLGRVTTQELYRETYALVCAPDDPAAAKETLQWADLEGQSLCLLTPDMQNRRIINRAFMDAGLTPEARMESNSTVVLVTHVEQGGWSTILPTDMARSLAKGRDLAVVPIARDLPGPSVGLVAPYQEPQTPVLQALLDEARELAN